MMRKTVGSCAIQPRRVRGAGLRERSCSFGVSFALHACFVGALIATHQDRSSVPFGRVVKGEMTLVDVGTGSLSQEKARTDNLRSEGLRNRKPLLRKSSSGDLPAKPIEKRIDPTGVRSDPVEAASKPRFGMTDGTANSGRLGDPRGDESDEKRRYIYELQRFIESRKVFPALSRRLNETGQVKVRFSISKDGSMTEVVVVEPCDHERLNQAAMSLIRGIGKFKPIPDEVGSEAMQLEIPVAYVLN